MAIGYPTQGIFYSKKIPFNFTSNKFKFIPIGEIIPNGCSINYFYKLNPADNFTGFTKNLDINIANSNGIYFKIELNSNGSITPSLDDYKIEYTGI